MPLQATSGAASYDAFGGGVPVAINYIEDVFSTYLYTGNGSTQTITNGIDESGKGAMTWIKCRSTAYGHRVNDTTRGASKFLDTSSTAAQDTNASVLTAFTSSGFSVGASTAVNESAATYASWTFRKQPKFFDIQTWTGTGANRTISHALGSVPACIMVKRTDTTGAWQVYHRSLANTQYLVLNTTAAVATGATRWNSTTPTSTEFSLGTDATVNASGGTYVAYIFAHDAGGFGLTGTDNVISCGSYTGNGLSDGPVVTLGYEPQWLLIKSSTQTGQDWFIVDNMRGFLVNSTGGGTVKLSPNTAAIESNQFYVAPTATGFQILDNNTNVNNSGSTYIYIAIRRGPMKVPTSGTSVFIPVTATGNGVSNTLTTNFPVDLNISKPTGSDLGDPWWIDRLRGGTQYLRTSSTAAELTFGSQLINFQSNTSIIDANYGSTAKSYVDWNFRRAPSFFDEVCITGASPQVARAHNLTVVPQIIITKKRSGTGNWGFWYGPTDIFGYLNTTAAFSAAGFSSYVTATTFYPLDEAVGATYVNYLFATCAGVSKVGSYTGTATTKQIDCGFTAGARFVLIKRTDSTGDWYVWDTARGIVSGNDPYLLLNSTAAEVTSTDYIDTYSAGFELSSTAPAAINASGGTYIFLAIA
jgi:hypothetical protein